MIWHTKNSCGVLEKASIRHVNYRRLSRVKTILRRRRANMQRVSSYAVSALTVTDIWRPCSAASEERAAWAAAGEARGGRAGGAQGSGGQAGRARQEDGDDGARPLQHMLRV
jgi:hypothetical protein